MFTLLFYVSDDEFPPGWTVKTYRRAGGETVGKTDRFWFSRKWFTFCMTIV